MAITSDGFRLRCFGPAIDEATACRPALRSYCWLYRSGYGLLTGVTAGLYPRMNTMIQHKKFRCEFPLAIHDTLVNPFILIAWWQGSWSILLIWGLFVVFVVHRPNRLLHPVRGPTNLRAHSIRSLCRRMMHRHRSLRRRHSNCPALFYLSVFLAWPNSQQLSIRIPLSVSLCRQHRHRSPHCRTLSVFKISLLYSNSSALFRFDPHPIRIYFSRLMVPLVFCLC